MEALVITLIATGNMYRQKKVSLPEPAKFEAFDLQALRLPDQKKHDSQGRPFEGKPSYVLQTAP
jgi:hypothetical protein